MADYYPLLSKAISGLPSNTLETRHEIYDRARTALLRQLASIDPPVAEAIVNRELGALEQVFTRLEMENLDIAVAPPSEPDFELAPLEETIAPVTNTRPQVHSVKKTEDKSLKPLLAVGFALAAVLVFTLATLAFLRRDVPPVTAGGAPVVAQRAPASTPSAEAASNVPKASDRVGAAISSDTPVAPAATPAPVAVPAAPVVTAPVTPAPAPDPAPPATPAPAQVMSTPAPAPPSQIPTAPPAISVANRAVLLVQNSDKQEDVTLRQGSVVWRNEVVSSAQSQVSDRSIKALIDIPEAKFQMEVTIQRNRDAAFPASHTIQIRSIPAVGSELGVIQGITTFEFRQVENQTGYSMAGQGIAVVDNLFLIALTNVDPALSRNVEMMKARPLAYLEFPLSNGRRGAILLDKGISGQQVFDVAFNSWQ